jgi:cobalt/nickel transport system permease protein
MDVKNKISEIYSLEQLSAGKTIIHQLHPMCKFITTLVFIVTVLSFGRHDLGRLMPFIFFPAILAALSETPFTLILKRVLIVMPFCLFIGISNLLLEGGTAFTLGNLHVSYGILSFLVIIYRAFLCVSAVLLLVAATPFMELTRVMRQLKIPEVFVVMFEMTYRYIGVLLDEAASMRIAYILRGGSKSIDIRHAGSFIGCLLLRSFDRAERIYSAMKCRGYPSGLENKENFRFSARDAVYTALVCTLCLLFRFTDIIYRIALFAERIL